MGNHENVVVLRARRSNSNNQNPKNRNSLPPLNEEENIFAEKINKDLISAPKLRETPYDNINKKQRDISNIVGVNETGLEKTRLNNANDFTAAVMKSNITNKIATNKSGDNFGDIKDTVITSIESLKCENVTEKDNTKPHNVENYHNSDVETLKSDVETLKSDVDTITSDIETLKCDADTITSDIETLECNADTISSDNETLKSDVDTITSDNETHKCDVDTITSDTEMLKSDDFLSDIFKPADPFMRLEATLSKITRILCFPEKDETFDSAEKAKVIPELQENTLKNDINTTPDYVNTASNDVNTTPDYVNVAPDYVNTTPDYVNTTPDYVNTAPDYVNITPNHVSTTPDYVNITPVHVNTTPDYININTAAEYVKTTPDIENESINKDYDNLPDIISICASKENLEKRHKNSSENILSDKNVTEIDYPHEEAIGKIESQDYRDNTAGSNLEEKSFEESTLVSKLKDAKADKLKLSTAAEKGSVIINEEKWLENFEKFTKTVSLQETKEKASYESPFKNSIPIIRFPSQEEHEAKAIPNDVVVIEEHSNDLAKKSFDYNKEKVKVLSSEQEAHEIELIETIDNAVVNEVDDFQWKINVPNFVVIKEEATVDLIEDENLGKFAMATLITAPKKGEQ